MPIHDWTKVDAGIFHAFHLGWISRIAHVLNSGLLPNDYYALPEQFASRYNPDVLTLKVPDGESGLPITSSNGTDRGNGGQGSVLTLPRLEPVAETDLEFYRRKQRVVTVRHVSDDGLVAVIEIVSSGNKSGRKPFRAFIEKAADLLDRGIHLLVLDLYPPGKRDPHGIHAEIWQEITGEEEATPKAKPFTFASYETGDVVRAYVEQAGVGDMLPDMPLFLEPQQTVTVPLETIYNAAYIEMPHRWRRVLEAPDN